MKSYCILGALLTALVPWGSVCAKENATWQYQVQCENLPQKNCFFFFRFNADTGEVQILAYDNRSQDSPVKWHPVDDLSKDAYVRVLKK
jgi:hypothetical protein